MLYYPLSSYSSIEATLSRQVDLLMCAEGYNSETQQGQFSEYDGEGILFTLGLRDMAAPTVNVGLSYMSNSNLL